MEFECFDEIKMYVQTHAFDELLALPLNNLAIVYGYAATDNVQAMVSALNSATAGKYTIILGDTIQAEVRDIKERFDQYEMIYEAILADKSSKEVLFNLLAFRLTRLERYILNAFCPDIQQYFDPSLAVYKKDCVYADCGALDGYTVAQFMLRCPSYKKIYFYEPVEEYYQDCVDNLGTLQASDVIARKSAVFDKNTTLRFNTNVAGNSKTDEAGALLVKAVTLDEDITEPLDFIKMDIEGSEKEALRGAERHISNDKPMLAICVYHLPCDLREILFLIREMNDSYRFYLRHHQYNTDETVLYAVPAECEKSDEEITLSQNIELACRRLIERLEKKEREELVLSKKHLLVQLENYMRGMHSLLSSIEESRAWSAQLNEAKEYLTAELQKRNGIIEELRVWSAQLNEAKEYFVAETQRQTDVIEQQKKMLDTAANENERLRYYLRQEIKKTWYKKLLHKSRGNDYNL